MQYYIVKLKWWLPDKVSKTQLTIGLVIMNFSLFVFLSKFKMRTK